MRIYNAFLTYTTEAMAPMEINHLPHITFTRTLQRNWVGVVEQKESPHQAKFMNPSCMKEAFSLRAEK